MMEVMRKKEKKWMTVDNKSIAEARGTQDSAFERYYVKINGIRHAGNTPAFQEAFAKEQVWARLKMQNG